MESTRKNAAPRPPAAERLTAAREAMGLSRADACRLFGFNPNTYKSHERGVRGFGYEEAVLYASAYRCSAESLLLSPSAPQPYPSETVRDRQDDPAAGPDADPDDAPHDASENGPSNVSVFHGGKSTADEGRPAARPREDNAAGRGGLSGTEGAADMPVAGAQRSIGAFGFGIWLSPDDGRLHHEALVPLDPGQPADTQYALEAIEAARSGLFAKGDYVIATRLAQGMAVPRTGLLHVERRKGGLVEHAFWRMSQGVLTCETSAEGAIPSFRFDADDPNVAIRGIAVSIHRKIL